jgi:hypothetical protein
LQYIGEEVIVPSGALPLSFQAGVVSPRHVFMLRLVACH